MRKPLTHMPSTNLKRGLRDTTHRFTKSGEKVLIQAMYIPTGVGFATSVNSFRTAT